MPALTYVNPKAFHSALLVPKQTSHHSHLLASDESDGGQQNLIPEIGVAFGAENDKAPRYRGRTMRQAGLLILLIMATASPAAAQSCATLSGQLDCRAAPTRQPATSPQPSRPRQDVDVEGYAETTTSNRGASTTLNNKVIDSHGIVEFGFSGSTKSPCRRPGYGTLCE